MKQLPERNNKAVTHSLRVDPPIDWNSPHLHELINYTPPTDYERTWSKKQGGL